MADLKADWTDADQFKHEDQNELSAKVNAHDAAIPLKYVKPAGGIPATDLVEDIRTALLLAKSALQPGGAPGGGAVLWDTIEGKPATFPPSGHTHTKQSLGLDRVDNTSDDEKPFSSVQAQQIGQYVGQTCVPRALGINKGDLMVATGITQGEFATLPRPADGYMYVADSSYELGYKQVPVGSGGSGGGGPSNDPRLVTAPSTRLGDGRAAGTPYTWTHNLGTKSIWPQVTRLDTGEIIGVKMIPNTINTCIITPDIVWPNLSRRIKAFGILGLVDEVSPSVAPTMTYVSTAGKKITVTVGGGTDNVGIAGYNMFYDTGGAKTYVGSTAAGNYEYTLPASGTSYNLTATAYDAEGLESPYSTPLVRSTAASLNVLWTSSGSRTRLTPGSGTSANLTANVVAKTGDALWVWAAISHGNYVTNAQYDTVTIVDDKGGTWVRVPFVNPDVNPGGQPSGSIMAFYCLNPEASAGGVTHNLTVAVADAGITIAATYIAAEAYANVVSVTGLTTSAANPGTTNLVLPSAVGSMNVFAIATANSISAGLNKTARWQPAGSDVAGYVDYLVTGDCAGAATSVAVTTTSNLYHVAVGAQLVKGS